MWIVPLIAAGCAGPTPPDKGASTSHTGSDPDTTFTLGPDLVLEDDGNFRFTQEWTLSSSEIRANAAEVYLTWDDKTQDAWGTKRAADSYDRLGFVKVAASRPDTLARLAIDDLDSVIEAIWDAPISGETDLTLSATGFDPTADLVEDDAVSWLVGLLDSDGARLDLRDGVFLVPRVAQPGINLAIPNTAGSTEWSMQFGVDELRTDSGHAAYTLDWSALTLDGYGKGFAAARVDELFVGRFEEVDEADDLGGDLLDLQAVSAGWWTLDPAGATSADLSSATDGGGGSFPGFTTDAQWLVGGRCTTCLGPAPQFLGIVVVRDP